MGTPESAGAAAPEPSGALVALVYDQLRRLAQHQLGRERTPPTLQATALVHEAWVRLEGGRPVTWSDRAHFFNAAALAMRRILVDRARARRTERGRVQEARVPIELVEAIPEETVDWEALDEALEHLADMDPRAHQVVQLRFFAGLPVEEVARLIGHSPRTVKREWRSARLWLYERLAHGDGARRGGAA